MSSRRKLQRRAKLTPLVKNAPPHGCEVCRSDEWRSVLMNDMMQEAMTRRTLGSSSVSCKLCEAKWLVTLFAKGLNQEVHISFKPITNEQLN